jgi:hypothetical protein
MRHFLIFIILPLTLFTHCTDKKTQCVPREIPNDSLIDEVLTSVIMLDSIFDSHLGTKELFFPYIYTMPKWTDTLVPPPPPFPIPGKYKLQYGYSYDKAFSYFNSLNDKEQREKDSLFIKCQSDTTINHFVSEKISSLFLNQKNDYYWFSLPIFSCDKKNVIISYSEEYYFGYITVLKKENKNWVRVYHSNTWMR